MRDLLVGLTISRDCSHGPLVMFFTRASIVEHLYSCILLGSVKFNMKDRLYET